MWCSGATVATSSICISVLVSRLMYVRGLSQMPRNLSTIFFVLSSFFCFFSSNPRPSFRNQLSVGVLLDAHGQVANHVGVMYEVSPMSPTLFHRLLHRWRRIPLLHGFGSYVSCARCCCVSFPCYLCTCGLKSFVASTSQKWCSEDLSVMRRVVGKSADAAAL